MKGIYSRAGVPARLPVAAGIAWTSKICRRMGFLPPLAASRAGTPTPLMLKKLGNIFTRLPWLRRVRFRSAWTNHSDRTILPSLRGSQIALDGPRLTATYDSHRSGMPDRVLQGRVASAALDQGAARSARCIGQAGRGGPLKEHFTDFLVISERKAAFGPNSRNRVGRTVSFLSWS